MRTPWAIVKLALVEIAAVAGVIVGGFVLSAYRAFTYTPLDPAVAMLQDFLVSCSLPPPNALHNAKQLYAMPWNITMTLLLDVETDGVQLLRSALTGLDIEQTVLVPKIVDKLQSKRSPGAPSYQPAVTLAVRAVQTSPAAKNHLFLSHDWGEGPAYTNHQRVKRVGEELTRRGLEVWLDENEITGDIDDEMIAGIDNSELLVTFITENYMQKVNQMDSRDRCKTEFKYAHGKLSNAKMITVVMEASMLDQGGWGGTLGAFIGTCLFIDLSSDEPALFARGIDALAAKARRLLPSTP